MSSSRIRKLFPMKRAFRIFRKDRSGSVAVEFSFIAIPFFMILFAIIDVSESRVIRFGFDATIPRLTGLAPRFSSKIFSLPEFATQSPRSCDRMVGADTTEHRTQFDRKNLAFKKCLCRSGFFHS